jgi:hypothetical protein
VQDRGHPQHRRRPDPVGDPPGDRADRRAGQRIQAAGQACGRVSAGALLDQQQQGERGHADAQAGEDSDDQQDPAARHPPHAKVLTQCGHGASLLRSGSSRT